MKMRTIKLNPEFLTETLQGKTAPFTSNLPDDIELLEIRYDLFSKQVLAIIRSDSFEDIEESYPIPEFNVIYKPSSKAESQPKLNYESKAKPTTDKASIQTSSDTRAVEEEFSPEQRELLSFAADEEYVFVKPIQYLKTEWNEINEVVRSLGGRWVKGDSFSYWVIPLQTN